MYTVGGDQHCGEVVRSSEKMWMDFVKYTYKIVFN